MAPEAHAQRRPALTPLARDGLVFLAAVMALWAIVWWAVSLGVPFQQGEGVAPWAIAAIAIAYLAFGAVVWSWFYVYRDERTPARGEFTVDEQHHVHEGQGSFRRQELHEGAWREQSAHVEANYAPRTRNRTIVLLGAVAAAIGVGAFAAWFSQRVEDPLAPLLSGALLIGALIIGAAVFAGDKPPRA